MKIDQFTKSTSPITVIVNISSPVAVKLARILLEQGSKILIVDKLNFSSRRLLGDLLKHKNCMFMDSESTFRNIDKFKKIDYVYYFLAQLSSGSTYPNIFAENMEIAKLSHKNFIRESNRIDAYLKLSLEFNATVTVVTSAYLAQFLENIPELNIQIQKYAESLLGEYVSKNKLNARVIRIGELIGEDGDASAPTNLSRLLRELILRDTINIFGDGLQQNYLVHTEDAVYALLKATFSKQAQGKTFIAAYSHPFTSLSLAYQLLELTTDEKQVVFNEVLPDYSEIVKLRDMCLAPSATSLDWEPQITLEQALAESLSSIAKSFNHPWKLLDKPSEIEVTKETGIKDEDSIGKISPHKGTKQVVSGFSGFIYSAYQRIIAEPVLWLINLPKSTRRKLSGAREQVKSFSIKSLIGLIGLIVAIFALWIVTPYVDLIISGVKLVSVTKSLEKDIAALETSAFQDYSDKIPSLLNSIIADYEQIGYWEHMPFVGDSYIEVGSMLQGYALYGQSSSIALKASAPAIEIVKGVSSITPNSPAGQISRDYFEEIDAIMDYRTEITQAAQDAQVAELRLSRIDLDKIPNFMINSFDTSTQLLSTYARAVNELGKFYDLIPYLLGYKDRRTYFLAMQNETELRATGGWFTTYAILGVENGQIRELTVNDVYNIDGQISGLAAPADMKRALDIKNYKVSLSNWDPELENVSSDIQTLLAQDGIYKPNDVMITSTFNVIEKILGVVGGVDTESLGLVTQINLHDKIGQLHEEFIPSSQAKVDSVSDFMPKLLEKIIQSSLEEKQEIVQILGVAVKERDIMIYSDDTTLRTNLLDEFDTYRSLKVVDQPLYIVDWNAGGNKVNKYITRVTDIEINEKKSTAKVVVTYTNESTKEEEYKMGIYQNVQRVYYPKSFEVTSFDGYTLNPISYKTDRDVPYVLGRTEVGISLAHSTTLGFKITSVPDKLFFLKQPGIETEVLHVKIIQAEASSISEQKLRNQGFAKIDSEWTKTYIRTEDVELKLR